MRSIVVLVLSLLVGSATAGVRDLDLGVGGILLGDTEEEVVAKLGKPIDTSDTGEGWALEYPGLTVLVGWVENPTPGRVRRVFELTATGPTICTPSGVCPGMPVAAATRDFGQPELATRETGEFLEYYSTESPCWLQIPASHGTIKSIRVVCQP